MNDKKNVSTSKKGIASRRALLKMAAWATPLAAAIRGSQAHTRTGAASVTSSDEILELGAQSAVERIRNGDIKAEAYVTHLLRHYQTQRHLNSFITINESRVLEEAQAVDRARANGQTLGPLAGLPFVVKDQINVAGYPTTSGNIALKDHVPAQNARIVDIVVNAGAIVLAKANCADLVGQVRPGGTTSANPYFGFVRNPYNPIYSPGGSSGGNGAAIAARIAPAGLGQDGGGSVRLPSAFCGIAGLRPSTFTPENFEKGDDRKRYSYEGMVLPNSMTGTIGPMARTVSDVAFLDEMITGQKVQALDLRKVRIGIPQEDYWSIQAMEPEVAIITQQAFEKLRAAGAQLVEIDYQALIDLNEGDRLGMAMNRPNNDLADWLSQNLPAVTPFDVTHLRDSYPCSGRESTSTPEISHEEAVQVVSGAARQYAEVFRSNGIVALAAPTVSILPPLVNSNGDTPGQKIPVNGRWLDEWDTIIYNLFWGARLGTPGLNVPMGLSSGLPVGLQLQGLPGDDSKILAVGMAVEGVLGRLPPPPLHQSEVRIALSSLN